MKTLSLFSGVGAFEMALKRLGVEVELVAYCEIDKFASKSYSAIHDVPEDANLWDVTTINTDTLPDFDLMTWGFPCQDISVAGKGAGIEQGTRSGLYYEGLRILQAKKPKYSIVENVKNLVGKKFKNKYLQMLDDFDRAGYNSYSKVLNAKDYGIPQNRERVFIISIRKDVDPYANTIEGYPWPLPFDNGLRLKDFLETEVDEKFYFTDKTFKSIEKIMKRSKEKGLGFRESIIKDTENEVAKCIDAHYACGVDGKRTATMETHKPLCVGKLDIKAHDNNKRVYSKEGCTPTITTMGGGHRQPKTMEHNKVRKLTPRECWRLMGFSDTDFDKTQQAGISNSQLYKQAGNSIVVDVLAHIMKPLTEQEVNQ